MRVPESLMLNFRSPSQNYVLTFEDDGKVAYAYLKRDGDIVGDVWLYNRAPTPAEPEWKDRTKIPFANPRSYVSDDARVTRAVTVDDIKVDWEFEHGEPVAYVHVFDDLFGVVGVGDKPGYARHAVKNGPLARVMKRVD